MALGHFHERVGESPRSDENFGTSGSKIALFVSEIWPFEVGICVRAHFTMQNLGSVKGPYLVTDLQGAKQQWYGIWFPDICHLSRIIHNISL